MMLFEVVIHFCPADILGGPCNNKSLVRQQRWLHSCYAGHTFDFRPVICLSELNPLLNEWVSVFVQQCENMMPF